MERKLNEQWIEELDGKKHMLKAVQSDHLCSGCAFSCTTFCRDPLMSKRDIDCSKMIIIKDLGVLNDDGLLPCPFCGEYPEKLVGNDTWKCGCELGVSATRQQAIDAWNRRA